MSVGRFRIISILLLLLGLVLGACAAPAAPAAPAASGDEAVADEPAEEVAAAPEGYAQPEILVDTDWVIEHLDDPSVQLVEVGTDADAYAAGHIPGAIFFHGSQDLTNPDDSTRGQILTGDALSDLMSRSGLTPETTVVVYDGSNNLWSSRAYWALRYYQHPDVRLYNGGSSAWEAAGQEFSTDTVALTPSEYTAAEADPEIRTTTEYIMEHLDDPNTVTCDTRGPEEYAGTDVRSDRGGHIPGAINLEWRHAVNSDGTFKGADELYTLFTTAGFTPDKEIITYCQTGVRGAHTWFVLSELLGFPNVRNYDGSWEEYGNRADTPIDQ